MASPQIENGYIKIANEIWDALARIRISGIEWQILNVVLRKTYGWNKKSDRISLGQFSQATGIKKPHVVRAVRGLQKKKMIIKKDNDPIPTYLFNKNFDEWKPLSKRITTYEPTPILRQFCYICGFDKAVNRHHITPQSEGGSDRNSNIIMLCPNCHALVHKGEIDERELIIKKDNVEGNEQNALSKMIPTKDTITKDKVKHLSFSNGKRPPTPYQDLVAIYHEELPELPHVRKLTNKRKLQARNIFNDPEINRSLDEWRRYCQHIRGSKFLMGQKPGQSWQADFEFITNPNKFVRIIEGKYH